jgi:hypothetical protein
LVELLQFVSSGQIDELSAAADAIAALVTVRAGSVGFLVGHGRIGK